VVGNGAIVDEGISEIDLRIISHDANTAAKLCRTEKGKRIHNTTTIITNTDKE
jgi:hypothetical protein